MPKFSEKEKELIKNKLMLEGEKLFITHGLKKVTVDDLVKSAGISHGAFYSFYKSKEHLFMEININHQEKIFKLLDNILENTNDRNPHERVKIVIQKMINYFLNNPIISQINPETWGYLERKIPEDLVQKNNLLDTLALRKLLDNGIKLSCPITVAAKALQIVFLNASQLCNDEEYDTIINIIINGTVDNIIQD